MYGDKIIGGGVATGGGVLATTGMNTMWLVAAGLTLLVAGLAIMRLTPKRRRVRR